jgi:hypothetical protein
MPVGTTCNGSIHVDHCGQMFMANVQVRKDDGPPVGMPPMPGDPVFVIVSSGGTLPTNRQWITQKCGCVGTSGGCPNSAWWGAVALHYPSMPNVSNLMSAAIADYIGYSGNLWGDGTSSVWSCADIACGGGGGGGCNNNGIMDNGETGIDCGGGGCPACAGPCQGMGSATWQKQANGTWATIVNCPAGTCQACRPSGGCADPVGTQVQTPCSGAACCGDQDGDGACDNNDCAPADSLQCTGCQGEPCGESECEWTFQSGAWVLTTECPGEECGCCPPDARVCGEEGQTLSFSCVAFENGDRVGEPCPVDSDGDGIPDPDDENPNESDCAPGECDDQGGDEDGDGCCADDDPDDDDAERGCCDDCDNAWEEFVEDVTDLLASKGIDLSPLLQWRNAPVPNLSGTYEFTLPGSQQVSINLPIDLDWRRWSNAALKAGMDNLAAGVRLIFAFLITVSAFGRVVDALFG